MPHNLQLHCDQNLNSDTMEADMTVSSCSNPTISKCMPWGRIEIFAKFLNHTPSARLMRRTQTFNNILDLVNIYSSASLRVNYLSTHTTNEWYNTYTFFRPLSNIWFLAFVTGLGNGNIFLQVLNQRLQLHKLSQFFILLWYCIHFLLQLYMILLAVTSMS